MTTTDHRDRATPRAEPGARAVRVVSRVAASAQPGDLGGAKGVGPSAPATVAVLKSVAPLKGLAALKGLSPFPVVKSARLAAAKSARLAALGAETLAAYPTSVRDPQRQATAARACARYAKVATTEAERIRYLERAAKYAALALHLRRVAASQTFTAARLHAGPSQAVHAANLWLEAARRHTDLTAPTRSTDRQPSPRSVSAHLRACTLLAAPGAPNGPRPAAAA